MKRTVNRKMQRGLVMTTLGAVALVSATAVGAISAEQTARKLALVHDQEVALERIVSGVCLMDAGHDVEANRARVVAARDTFEATLPLIKAEIAGLDPKLPAARTLQRQIDKKVEHWFRFRVFLDREMKAHASADSVLGELALMEEGLARTIERVYKVLKKNAAKHGEITMAEQIAEAAAFEHLFRAERMVKEACLVTLGEGGAEERAKLGEAVDHFALELDAEEQAITTPPAARAMIDDWRALLPEVRAMARGEAPAADLLSRLDALNRAWAETAAPKA